MIDEDVSVFQGSSKPVSWYPILDIIKRVKRKI